MLTPAQITALDDQLAGSGSEIVSLYLDVNPATHDNARKAWALRARAAMNDLALPAGVARRIAERLRSVPGSPEAKSLAVFANAGDDEPFKTLFIDRELAVLGAHGGAIARYGSPLLAPLRLTLMRRRPSLVLQLAGDRIRMFICEPGGIVELPTAEQDWDETFWRESGRAETGSPTVLASGGSSHDMYEDRTEHWHAQLRKRVAAEIVDTMHAYGAARTVVVGTEPDVAAFVAELDAAAASVVTATLPLPPNPDAGAGALRAYFAGAIAEAELAEGEARLAKAIEKGVLGLNLTLGAVNESRVYELILPNVPYGDVWRCSTTGFVFGNSDAARSHCAGGAVEGTKLGDILPDLAAANGMELTFLSGDADRRLREDHGGLAGLLRW